MKSIDKKAEIIFDAIIDDVNALLEKKEWNAATGHAFKVSAIYKIKETLEKLD